MGRRGQGGRGGRRGRCVARKVSLGVCVCSDGCLVQVLFFSFPLQFHPARWSGAAVRVGRSCAAALSAPTCGFLCSMVWRGSCRHTSWWHHGGARARGRGPVTCVGAAAGNPSHLLCKPEWNPGSSWFTPSRVSAPPTQRMRVQTQSGKGKLVSPLVRGTTARSGGCSSGAAQAGLNAGDAPRVRRARTRAGAGWLWRRPLCPKVEGASLFPPKCWYPMAGGGAGGGSPAHPLTIRPCSAGDDGRGVGRLRHLFVARTPHPRRGPRVRVRPRALSHCPPGEPPGIPDAMRRRRREGQGRWRGGGGGRGGAPAR